MTPPPAPIVEKLMYMQRLFRLLLKSRNFSREELDFLSLPVIHELVYRIFSIVTPFSLIPAFYISLQRQQFSMLACQCVLGVIVILHAVLLLKKNYRILPPFMMFSVSMVLYILAIVRGEHFAMYWAQAFIVAFYLLFKRRTARNMNIGAFFLNSALSLAVFPVEQSLYFIGSLATTGILIEVLFGILNRHEKYLQRMATRDPLTGAFNRRRMIEDLEQALAMWDRYSEPPASIIMIDVDHFKTINDTFGHQEGDTVLINLVTTLSMRLRRTDKLYRYGGEEFLVLLAGTPLPQAAYVAEIFCEQTRAMSPSSKTGVTISCGVASARANEKISDWLARCDAALYQAKTKGRDRIELSDADAMLASPALR